MVKTNWSGKYERIKRDSRKNECMEQAIAYMEDFLNDEEIQDVYDKIVDITDKAEQKGKRSANINTARNMLTDGLSMDDIMKYTGLSIKEIETINKSVEE